jgi:hypothetical protein
VLTTDYIGLIHDDDCVRGLELLEHQRAHVERMLGLGAGAWSHLAGLFGVSGICNVLGAIRLAHYLNLGDGDNVVTIATDGFDRYPSVLANLAEREGPFTDARFEQWFDSIFRHWSAGEILDVRPREQKERLFRAKEEVWTPFGYTRPYLERMQSQSFWDAEFAKIGDIDQAVTKSRLTSAGS